MYNVSKNTSEKYGNLIEIVREELGQFEKPFQAVNQALTLKRLWADGGKIRFLIDGQILNAKQIEKWANDEYKSLPKCEGCAKILNGDVYTNVFSGDRLFCSQNCADKNFIFEMEKLADEEDIEYL